MPFLRKRLIFLIIVLSFFGCKNSYKQHSSFIMGTIVEITLSKNDQHHLVDLTNYMNNLAEYLKANIKHLNEMKMGEKDKFDPTFIKLIEKGIYYSEISGGRFDITIYTLMKLYGFPEGPYDLPDDAQISEAAKNISYRNIILNGELIGKKSNFEIDMGAYAKGWIVDETVKKMKEFGIKDGIINAGGDLYCLGDKDGEGWIIGIQHPDEKGRVISIIKLKNKAVATSGDYERFFIKDGKKYIHIFDALKKKPADNYKSVSVIADTVEMADALSTVYYLMTPEEIKKVCKEMKSPVMVYNHDNKKLTFCGWEQFEKN